MVTYGTDRHRLAFGGFIHHFDHQSVDLHAGLEADTLRQREWLGKGKETQEDDIGCCSRGYGISGYATSQGISVII